jgi:molybdenum cofactor guanylyltransferase
MMNSKLTGLVICGGTSSRMGQDKSLIHYHGESQRNHVAGMLSVHCSSVYLSLNEHQQAENEQYPVIRDAEVYANNGPIAAILSAFHLLPDENFMVIGCDYPLLTASELSCFISSVQNLTKPKAFFNEADGFYEPLLAFYPATTASFILNEFQEGNQSLQRILKMLNCEKYLPQDKNSIRSVDDPEAHRQILQQLKH